MCYVLLLNPYPLVASDAPGDKDPEHFRFFGKGERSRSCCLLCCLVLQFFAAFSCSCLLCNVVILAPAACFLRWSSAVCCPLHGARCCSLSADDCLANLLT